MLQRHISELKRKTDTPHKPLFQKLRHTPKHNIDIDTKIYNETANIIKQLRINSTPVEDIDIATSDIISSPRKSLEQLQQIRESRLSSVRTPPKPVPKPILPLQTNKVINGIPVKRQIIMPSKTTATTMTPPKKIVRRVDLTK